MSHLGLLQLSFQNLTSQLDNACICDQRGQILFMKNPHPFDGGTWGEAFKWAIQYFSMSPGDVLIFNDPYSGGNDFSVFSFITCLQKPGDQRSDLRSGIYLGHRCPTDFSFSEALQASQNGFRVPLTPIAQSGKIQEALLSAMCSAPAAPQGLKKLVESQVQASLQSSDKFQALPDHLFSQKHLQKFIEETRIETLIHLKEKAWGETKMELHLDSGEHIKLDLEMKDLGVRVDFGGTSGGKQFFLPPAALSGICYFFISHYLNLSPHFNSGLFSAIQVSQPANSCLSAKFPQATTKGFKIGARVIATLLDLAFNKLHPKPFRGISNHCGLYAQFIFKNRKPLELFLPNGMGATAEEEGVGGIDLLQCESPYVSAENIEANWPVRLLRLDLRNSNMGKGKLSGGRGLILKFEIMEDGDLFWISEFNHLRFPVQKHQTSPDKFEVKVEGDPHPSGPTGEESSSGRRPLKKGQFVILGSGSGGGLI